MDDGAGSMEEALAMAEMAAVSGISCMAATPHWQLSQKERFPDRMQKRQWILEQLNETVYAAGISLQIVPGMEIYGCGDIAGWIRDGAIHSLNHSGYYLIEFPFDMAPEEIYYGWKQIIKSGGRPVIAHPERYFCIQDEPELLYHWIQEGVYTQIHRGSLLGRFGDAAEKTSHLLTSCGLATCVASDAHHSYVRTPYFSDIRYLLKKWYSEETAQRLLSVNPCRMLLGESVLSEPVHYPGKRKKT